MSKLYYLLQQVLSGLCLEFIGKATYNGLAKIEWRISQTDAEYFKYIADLSYEVNLGSKCTIVQLRLGGTLISLKKIDQFLTKCNVSNFFFYTSMAGIDKEVIVKMTVWCMHSMGVLIKFHSTILFYQSEFNKVRLVYNMQLEHGKCYIRVRLLQNRTVLMRMMSHIMEQHQGAHLCKSCCSTYTNTCM